MSGGVKNSSQPKSQQAQWNVQVVKGKVTTRCLWNACKALSVGLLLLTIGTTMAVIGYYADQLSIRSETRGNSTVNIKNESRGFHLNNLSYAGPIVMGVGGFIVVAACVMTFEARDSAAKVVPARFKPNLNTSITSESTKATPRTSKTFQKMETKRSASVQTPGGCSGVCRLESTGSELFDRHNFVKRAAFTAAFVQFSGELMESSTFENNRRWKQKMSEMNLNKSPSAPNLAMESLRTVNENAKANAKKQCKESPRTADRNQKEQVCPFVQNKVLPVESSGKKPVTLDLEETDCSNIFLRPSHLQRQALSMDNPFYDPCEYCTFSSMSLSRQQRRRSGESKESFEMELGSSAGVSGSQTSMALDLHDCQVTLKVKDESANRRSETAKRHQLLRQKPVEDDIIFRCACVPRFLCATAVEECSGRTKSSTNLKSPFYHCLRASGSCSARGPPKMVATSRSHSYSPTCSYDRKKTTLHEDNLKIFCIDNQRKRNLSSENVRRCCEEKHRQPSPGTSPRRSSRTECRVRLKGSECVVHRTSGGNQKRSLSDDSSRPSRKTPPREGSPSAESPGGQSASFVAGNEPEPPS